MFADNNVFYVAYPKEAVFTSFQLKKKSSKYVICQGLPKLLHTTLYSAFLVFKPLKVLYTTCHIHPFAHTFIQ